jgi:hypothetical protein
MRSHPASKRSQRETFEFDAFLSHSSLDKPVVREVAEYLEKRNIKVWFDEKQIHIGDLIPHRIDEGLEMSRHVVVCMSPNFFGDSEWGALEAAAAKMRDPANRRGAILPLLIEECKLPPTFEGLLFADYSTRNKSELGRLSDRILSTRPAARDDESELALTSPGIVRHVLDRACPRFHRWLTRIRVAGFDFPPEHRVLEAFNEAVYMDASKKLHDQTIVRLRAKSLQSGPDQSGARKGAFHLTIHQAVREIEGRRETEDAASATISALSRKSRPVRHLVSRILRDQEPLVLLGEPGSGKSLSIHQARSLVSQRNLSRVYPDICVYVPLGEFHVATGDVTDHSLAEFVKRRVDAEIRPYLWSLRRSQRLVMFLDGMDEMSRRRYNDHVEAISDFARGGEGKAKTVVACRTADFSPKFQHRRFVLLPFERQQIQSYLRLQFGDQPVKIGDKFWHSKALARELARGDLPIDATSPYVLWMFCRFIDSEGNWPKSRAQLLEHYYTLRLKEHLAKENQAVDSDAVKGAFAIWGRIAFQLAIAHRGVVISAATLSEALGPDDTDLGIKLGRATGLLEVSLVPQADQDDTSVKFEHHRAAEFFTAYHISTTNEPVEWEELFNYPRWRETLLHVLVRGGSADARAVVEQALDSAATLEQSSEDWRDERDLVERVEVAARAHTDAHQSAEFAGRLASAVYHLAESGNPITRIRMLEIARRTPDLDVYQVAEPSLESDVEFLRTQAMVVASASGNEASRRFLPHQLLFSFAGGEFFKRTREFLSVAGRLKQLRPALLVLCGCLFLAVSPLLQLVAVHTMVESAGRTAAEWGRGVPERPRETSGGQLGFDEWRFGLVERTTGRTSFRRRFTAATREREEAKKEDGRAKTESRRPAWRTVSTLITSSWTYYGLLLVTVVGWCVAALLAHPAQHIAGVAGAIASLSLLLVGVLTWTGYEGLAFGLLAVLLSFWWLVALAYSLMAASFVACVALYCVAGAWITRAPIRMRRYAETAIDSIWQDGRRYARRWRTWVTSEKVLLVVLALPAVLAAELIFDMGASVLSDGAVAWASSSNFRIFLFQVGPIYALGAVFLGLRTVDRSQSALSRLLTCVGLLIGLAVLMTVLDLVVRLISKQTALIAVAMSTGVWGLRIVVLLILAALLGGFCWLTWKLGQALRRRFAIFVVQTRDSRSWQEKFATSTAPEQAILLRRVSAEQLRMSPEEFLTFLAETCKPSLKRGDPPASDYWRKWQEASELARMEREGGS